MRDTRRSMPKGSAKLKCTCLATATTQSKVMAIIAMVGTKMVIPVGLKLDIPPDYVVPTRFFGSPSHIFYRAKAQKMQVS